MTIVTWKKYLPPMKRERYMEIACLFAHFINGRDPVLRRDQRLAIWRHQDGQKHCGLPSQRECKPPDDGRQQKTERAFTEPRSICVFKCEFIDHGPRFVEPFVEPFVKKRNIARR